MAMGQEDEKYPKRARVVLSQGHEVVGLGYSTMSSAIAMGKDKGMR
jgi:transketolase N-terminal domain/subunit